MVWWSKFKIQNQRNKVVIRINSVSDCRIPNRSCLYHWIKVKSTFENRAHVPKSSCEEPVYIWDLKEICIYCIHNCSGIFNKIPMRVLREFLQRLTEMHVHWTENQLLHSFKVILRLIRYASRIFSSCRLTSNFPA